MKEYETVFGELDSHQPAATPYGRRHTGTPRQRDCLLAEHATSRSKVDQVDLPLPLPVLVRVALPGRVSMMRGGAARAS